MCVACGAWCSGVWVLTRFRNARVDLAFWVHPVLKSCCNAQCACRQCLLNRGPILIAAAKIQRSWNQVKCAGLFLCTRRPGWVRWVMSCWGMAGCQPSRRMPAARIIRAVRIKGSEIKAVGSSLVISSSKAMPKPSLFGASGAIVGLFGTQIVFNFCVTQRPESDVYLGQIDCRESGACAHYGECSLEHNRLPLISRS